MGVWATSVEWLASNGNFPLTTSLWDDLGIEMSMYYSQWLEFSLSIYPPALPALVLIGIHFPNGSFYMFTPLWLFFWGWTSTETQHGSQIPPSKRIPGTRSAFNVTSEKKPWDKIGRTTGYIAMEAGSAAVRVQFLQNDLTDQTWLNYGISIRRTDAPIHGINLVCQADDTVVKKQDDEKVNELLDIQIMLKFSIYWEAKIHCCFFSQDFGPYRSISFISCIISRSCTRCRWGDISGCSPSDDQRCLNRS